VPQIETGIVEGTLIDLEEVRVCYLLLKPAETVGLIQLANRLVVAYPLVDLYSLFLGNDTYNALYTAPDRMSAIAQQDVFLLVFHASPIPKV
jgi:hypothetical protein